MSISTMEWGVKHYYTAADEKLSKMVRVLIESIKDDSTVVVDESSFTLFKDLKRSSTQQATTPPVTGSTIFLTTASLDYISIKVTAEHYDLVVRINGENKYFYISDENLYTEYAAFVETRWINQVNSECVSSINELFNQTELKRKVDLDNLLHD